MQKALSGCCRLEGSGGSPGQRKLFDSDKCFFYITNDWEGSATEIVFDANQRCDQENLIEQQKNGVRSLTAPLDGFDANWAYMVIASLAGSLKIWAALLVPVHPCHRAKHEQQKRRLLRIDFATFRNAIMNIPAQIARSGQRLVNRLLGWNDWQEVFFRLYERLDRPLRC